VEEKKIIEIYLLLEAPYTKAEWKKPTYEKVYQYWKNHLTSLSEYHTYLKYLNVKGPTISDSEYLSYNLMLNSGKKFALCTTTKINILTLVLSEKKILNKTKNHNPPPLQVKWSIPKQFKM
jgi:hypothetical protein